MATVLVRLKLDDWGYLNYVCNYEVARPHVDLTIAEGPLAGKLVRVTHHLFSQRVAEAIAPEIIIDRERIVRDAANAALAADSGIAENFTAVREVVSRVRRAVVTQKPLTLEIERREAHPIESVERHLSGIGLRQKEIAIRLAKIEREKSDPNSPTGYIEKLYSQVEYDVNWLEALAGDA